eukprot:SAG31_NODE_19161_length_610_cov_1.273973_2_plen_102_part_01
MQVHGQQGGLRPAPHPQEPVQALQSWVKHSQRLMGAASGALSDPELAAAVSQMQRATAVAVSTTRKVVELEQSRKKRQDAEAQRRKQGRNAKHKDVSPDQAG